MLQDHTDCSLKPKNRYLFLNHLLHIVNNNIRKLSHCLLNKNNLNSLSDENCFIFCFGRSSIKKFTFTHLIEFLKFCYYRYHIQIQATYGLHQNLRRQHLNRFRFQIIFLIIFRINQLLRVFSNPKMGITERQKHGAVIHSPYLESG